MIEVNLTENVSKHNIPEKLEIGMHFVRHQFSNTKFPPRVYVLTWIDADAYALVNIEEGIKWAVPKTLDNTRRELISDGFKYIRDVKITIDAKLSE